MRTDTSGMLAFITVYKRCISRRTQTALSELTIAAVRTFKELLRTYKDVHTPELRKYTAQPESRFKGDSQSCAFDASCTCFQRRAIVSGGEIEARLRLASFLLLLFCPDWHTAWNFRKAQLVDLKIDVSSELGLTTLILRKHPKSGCTWQHRRFLMKLLRRHGPLQPHDYEREFAVCTRAADAYPKNYMAWNYRRLVLGLNTHGGICSEEVLMTELAASDVWMQSHIGDYSALRYRALLLKLISFSCRNTKQRTKGQEKDQDVLQNVKQSDLSSQGLHRLEVELTSNQSQIHFYSGHEALWVYRRDLLDICQTLLPKTHMTAMLADEADWVQCHSGAESTKNIEVTSGGKVSHPITGVAVNSESDRQQLFARHYLQNILWYTARAVE
ncbi:hypothetical protein SARC_06475 [Sphaeroforma arctica JP610]|uniref:Protein prenyltransferase alpha subunit repeat-containing protein 1 n=1 Tax=Sphaeroforma arctica JP610 TaxID=667725 RepID=A0A0L0FWK0_9EUKA|nr:hypothetical protein SARC_06475 [Sphaeroforma arctica JP610]KNC81192.1 hypothetical protein SARC_06475 [Sphaeroforma arctica JP610]|eukprot:XP_014155094.1 hypothetical protein SARC_06475 [Sphaeroforma arctica JP610]